MNNLLLIFSIITIILITLTVFIYGVVSAYQWIEEANDSYAKNYKLWVALVVIWVLSFIGGEVMPDFLQIMLAIYLTIGVVWTLALWGAILSSKDAFRASFRGEPVHGFKKVLVIIVLAIYTTLLWPASVGAVLLG